MHKLARWMKKGVCSVESARTGPMNAGSTSRAENQHGKSPHAGCLRVWAILLVSYYSFIKTSQSFRSNLCKTAFRLCWASAQLHPPPCFTQIILGNLCELLIKATPHNGARRFGVRFRPKRKYEKCGNTLCISHFSYCTIGAKDPSKPAAPIVRCCLK